ncbi:cysteine hydrolase family protein [Francisella frigiditurris]|uniref:Isochorismatase family protein n=1 Tax=Francisella frigiditurris TaxID=1542390 RepID=A0A1J0KTU8_9GAMM|nr:isochorismatase family cysteine hydrolase [Francisella frigiditurris]APC97189.1 isochorismatase family protein [Francisella frigiditurris]
MRNRLLLAIDFINDIVHPDGKLGAKFTPYLQENNVLENATKAIKHAREKNILVAHVKVTFSKTYIECPEWSPIFGSAKKNNALELNTWGTQFHEKIDIKENDHILIKHRISAFYNTDLESVLRANKIEEIIIIGVSTDMTVELTSREAHDRDYKVTVLKDACGSHASDTHNASLANISRVGMVKTVQEWINS